MKMIKAFLSVVLLISVSASTSHAAFFETAGEGVRPSGMGEAFTVLAKGIDAIWYNPAGLGKGGRKELGVSYGRPFLGLDQGRLHRSSINLAVPLGWMGGTGLGISRLDAGSASETAIALGYGFAMWEQRILAGVTAKLLQWSANGQEDPISGVKDKDWSSRSFSVDAGGICRIVDFRALGSLHFGFAFYNIIQPDISEAGSEGKLTRKIKGGFLYEGRQLAAEIDMSYSESVKKLYIGGEQKLRTTEGSGFLLRFGGSTDFEAEGRELSLGFGYIRMGLTIDYAYRYPVMLNMINGSHFTSLRYQF